MCFDGSNSAAHSVRYLNAQLLALWQNASECVKRHGQRLQPGPAHKYAFALAEFHYGAHRPHTPAIEDLHFYASFGQPSLEFICNHEAVLHLKLKSGHLGSEYKKADIHGWYPVQYVPPQIAYSCWLTSRQLQPPHLR
jgi:hypothetical protein